MAEALLRGVNKKALAFFSGRGKRYLNLKDEMKEHEFEPRDLGDLEVIRIQKVAEVVRDRFEKNEKELEDMKKTWASYVEMYKKVLESPVTDPSSLPKIQAQKDEAQELLNLTNLFGNIYSIIKRNKSDAIYEANKIRAQKEEVLHNIEAGNLKDLINNAMMLNTNIDNYLNAMKEIAGAEEAYYQATTANLEKTVVETISLPDAEELYGQVIKAIDAYNVEKNKGGVKAPEFERAAIALEQTLGYVEKLIGPEKTKEIRKRLADKMTKTGEGLGEKPPVKPKTETKSDADLLTKEQENFLKTFKRQLSFAYGKLFEQTKKKYHVAGWQSEGYDKALEVKQNLLYKEFKELPFDVKKEIDLEMNMDYIKHLRKHFGEEVYRVISKVSQIKRSVSDLNKLNSDNPEIIPRLDEIKEKILELVNSEDAKSIGLKYSIDDKDNVIFIFNNPDVEDYRLTILGPELMAKVHPVKKEEPKPIPVPPTPTPVPPKTEPKKEEPKKDEPKFTPPLAKPTASEEEDLKYYLALLAETNAQIAEINRINSLLILHNRLSDLSLANISEDVNVETTAVHASALVTRMRVELSEARYNYLKKHGKYILSNPEAREAKIDDIVFEADFEKFVRERDVLIADAEIRIRELMDSKPKGYEEEVNKLVEFIKAQNSLINRFLVAKAVSRSIDVTKFLTERNERRKELIEAKLKGKPVEPIREEPTTKPVKEEPKKEEPKPIPVPPEPKKEEPPVEEPKKEEPTLADIKHVNVTVKETALRFNPRNDKGIVKKISPSDRLFKSLPKVTTTLIKNGVRIELSKALRERLAELNAKISLVNNKVKNSRTSRMVDANAEYQDITFKKDHDVNLEDYKVEVRIPGEKQSQLLFETGEEELQRRM